MSVILQHKWLFPWRLALTLVLLLLPIIRSEFHFRVIVFGAIYYIASYIWARNEEDSGNVRTNFRLLYAFMAILCAGLIDLYSELGSSIILPVQALALVAGVAGPPPDSVAEHPRIFRGWRIIWYGGITLLWAILVPILIWIARTQMR